MIVSSGIRACSFFFRTGDCESALFALLFAHSLFWHMHWLARRKTNDKTQLSASFPGGMKRLNSLHPSLGAWKKQKNNIKNKKTTLCLRHSGPVGLLGFLGFLVFFLFFVFCFSCFFCCFLFLLVFRPSLRSISSSGLRCVCFHMSAWRNPSSTIKKNLKRDLSELKIKIISFFWGWLGWKPFFLNLLNSKA